MIFSAHSDIIYLDKQYFERLVDTMHLFAELLEALTIFCFGLSWPLSIRKSYISRTAKGKSLFFQVFILIGYGFGIIRKILQTAMPEATGTTYSFIFFLGFFFYVLNFTMIAIDIALYFRNVKLDRERAASGKEDI